MNGTIDPDVLNDLADGYFKRIGKTPSLTEWKERRDQMELDLRLNALSRILGKDAWSRIMGEAAYSAEPQCMSMSDMSTLLGQVIKQEAEKDGADFVYWSKIPLWTLEEATALSFGKAPQVVNSDNVQAYHGQSSFADDYSKRLSLLLRAQEAGELPVSIPPGEFISWAERTGIALPQDLVDAVRASAGLIEDRRSLAAERDELREKVKRLEEEAAKEKPLSTRERETYQKMILGMAIKKYRYNPTGGRSNKPREIADDLADLQIPVSDDTVRQKLNDAFDTVGLLPEVIETLK